MVAVTPVRVTLVRHGSTSWTVDKRFCGWSDIPLQESGREQAAALRGRLPEVDWTGTWSSDLVRCTATAELAGFAVTTDSRLREFHFGALEGSKWEELEPETRRALLDFKSFSAPDGESMADFEARLRNFIDALAPGDHLIFTHGGPIRWFLDVTGTAYAGMIPPCAPVSLTLP